MTVADAVVSQRDDDVMSSGGGASDASEERKCKAAQSVMGFWRQNIRTVLGGSNVHVTEQFVRNCRGGDGTTNRNFRPDGHESYEQHKPCAIGESYFCHVACECLSVAASVVND